MDIDYEKIGQRIKYMRVQYGLSQEELAEFSNISSVYISNIEQGKKSISLKVVISIANALNVSTDVLLADCLTNDECKYNFEEFSIFADCSKTEKSILIDIVKETKIIIRKYSK